MFLFRHKTITPQPRYGAFLYFIVILLFAVIAQYDTVVGFIGLGSLLLVAGIYVEMNATQIWTESQAWVKKNRKKIPWWNRPTSFFYVVNIYILWPLIIVMGVFSFVLAYKLAGIVH